MVKLISIFIFFTIIGYANDMSIEKQNTSSSFSQVWGEVASDSLEVLPQDNVSFFKLFSSCENIMLKDSQRTLDDSSDILEPFEKLAHPNGICLKGVWKIDTQNIYSGYFKKSSQALIIARASSAMSNTKSGEIRSFGLAGKLFPTLNEDQICKTRANFFLIDNLGGTDTKYFTDVELTNEPPLSMTLEVIKNILYALEVSRVFNLVDGNSTIRQLYEISELGESDGSEIITPKWMKIEAKDAPKVDLKDFRDELSIENNKKLVFNIHVANKMLKEDKDWQKIGSITFDSSMVSTTCDHRLHFHHPKWRSDLDYGDKNR